MLPRSHEWCVCMCTPGPPREVCCSCRTLGDPHGHHPRAHRSRSRSAAAPLKGQQHPGRTMHGARGALVRPVQKPRVGHQPLLPSGPRGALRPHSGPGMPAGPTEGRAGPPGPRPPRATRGGGGAIRLVGQGAPCISRAPGHRACGDAPMRGTP